MKIVKEGKTDLPVRTNEELELINAFAKAKLTEDEVYTFSVLLCDNEVDRDFERFSEETLKELSELFVGATGICDHDWRSTNQVARIYRTELITDKERKNSLGMPYVYLKGYAYMLRNEGNAELISQIEGGIKRETSVGCSVASSVCSVCGNELGSAECGHSKGNVYGGKLCYALLEGAVDAYEWSFVAVPAQRNAGVIKGYKLDALKKEADIGRRYLKELRKEVLRLCLICDENLYPALSRSVESMDEESLSSMRKAFETRTQELFMPATQLPGKNDITDFCGEDYII